MGDNTNTELQNTCMINYRHGQKLCNNSQWIFIILNRHANSARKGKVLNNKIISTILTLI